MSELAVTIRDANHSVCGQVHGSVVDKLVAALSADPETIEELQAAVMRFVPPDESLPIAHFRRGEDDEPYDAGVCIIDLAARYVAYESSYSSLGRAGTIDYLDHDRRISVGLPFHLADGWFFDHSIDSWRANADERRRRRRAVPQIDVRAVLYDCLAPFVARQCLATRDAGGPAFVARFTPAEMITRERQRIPYALTGKAAMVDCDCPMCQMIADNGPMFIGFDGCNNDDDFPFTTFATREGFEEAEREREEFNREFEEEEKLRKAGLLEDDDWGQPKDEDLAGGSGWGNSIWQRSFSAPEKPDDGVSLQVFGIACHLGELVTDLKDPPGGAQFVEPLNRYFGNVRAALQGPEAGGALLAPAVDRFCEELDEAAAVREDLREKCLDLQRQARRFAAHTLGELPDDDVPF